jgi:hypothetical protein
MELSNVIAGNVTIRIQQGTSFPPFYFEFYDADDVAIDLTTIIGVFMDVYNATGVRKLRNAINSGFSIENHPETGLPTLLVLDKEFTLNNLAAGNYSYDMLVVLTATVAQVPQKGMYIVEKTNTKYDS